MKKVFCITLVFAMVMCLFAGCGKNDKPSPDGTPVLKIGTIGPLTGDAAQYGNATKHGAELAAKEINAKGGVQIEVNGQDDENDAENPSTLTTTSSTGACRFWSVRRPPAPPLPFLPRPTRIASSC